MPESATTPGPRRRAAVIGLGKMGGAMALRLLEAGHSVTGFDVDQTSLSRFVALGGQACDSPAMAARDAEVLLVMVHESTQVDRVFFGESGAADGMPRGCVAWLGSTVSPVYARQLAEKLGARGIAFIDGPVSGGATGAEDGNLVAICGAAPEALAAAGFALGACTQRVYAVGPPGAGSTVKMINQLLVAAHSALTSEAMALTALAGVNPAQLIEVITHSAGNSRIFEKRAPRIAAGDHAVHVTIDTLRKDLQIAIDTAAQLGLDPLIARSVHTVLTAAVEAGHGGRSDTTLVDDYLGLKLR